MNFDLDDEQTMVRDLVARYAADRVNLSDRARDRQTPTGFSPSNWRMLGELGLLSLPFSTNAGGMGGGVVELITVMEQLGRGLCTDPYLSDLLLGGRLLERAGTVAQRDTWLPAIMAGDKRIVLAHAETAARFHPTYVQCRAAPLDDGWQLTGSKTFVLSAEGADAFIVSARDHGAPDATDGLSLWLVPAETAHLERRCYRLIDDSVACELRLHGVTGAERLDGGSDALLASFDEARIAACAEMIGVMTLLFEQTLEHLRTRKQFGQPIGSFQAIQHRMADQYAALEQARSQMLRAALTVGPGASAAIAGAKAFVSEAAVRLGEECIQFHGGMGISDELAIGHGHKRILLLATLLGDSESELGRYVALTA